MNQSNLPTRHSPAALPTPGSAYVPLSSPGSPGSPRIVQAEPALSLLEILLRHKGKMIACVLIAMILGVVYQLTADKVYESTAEVFIQKTRDGQPNSPLSPKGMSAGLPSTHARLLESSEVLLAALNTPKVADSPTMAEFGDDQEKKLRHLQKNLTVAWSKESEVVTVSYRSNVPQDAADIVNAVVGAYLLNLKVVVDQAPPAVADATPTQNPGPRGVMDEEILAARLMTLSEELTAAEVALETADIRHREAMKVDGDLNRLSSLLAEAGGDSRSHGLGEIAYLRAELARLEQQMEGMPDSWGPSHKIRGPVQRQVDALRYEIGNLRHSVAANMLALIASNREHAATRVDELRARIATQQARAAQLAQLPVDVFQRGRVPSKKVAPKGVKTMGIAVFLGLAAGLVLVLRSEMNNPAPAPGMAPAPGNGSTRGLDVGQRQVTDTTGSAVGALPRLMRGEDMAAAFTTADDGPPMLGLVPEAPTGSRLTSPNFDATASSIHQIRAVLQVQARSQDTKAFAFTSPRRGAGKTSVAIGVASSLAMSGTRTLVVDCDLAGRISRGQTGAPAKDKNGQTNGHASDSGSGQVTFDRFGPLDPEGSSAENASMDNIVIEQGYVSEDVSHSLSHEHVGKVGVTGMLDGAPLEQCVVQATVPGLSLLPAVNAHTRHIGKMSDAFIRRLIDEARESYDLVLFDTGPVPGSVEALLVTSQVDGVIVVVPQGEARQALDRTMSYLKVVGAKVTGTVFNRASDAPQPGEISADYPNLAGAAAAAAGAEAGRQVVEHAGDNGEDPLVELEKQQNHADKDDGDFLAGDAPLGSGILAAAVFSDADSGYDNQDWKLEETSDFNGSVDELFGEIDGQKKNGHKPS